VSGQAWLREHVLLNRTDSFILLNEENISAISKKGEEVSSNQKHIFQVGYFQVFTPTGHCCSVTAEINHLPCTTL
jgi:hypothetical protein